MTDINMTDKERLSALKKACRRAEAQWNMGMVVKINQAIEELTAKIRAEKRKISTNET